MGATQLDPGSSPRQGRGEVDPRIERTMTVVRQAVLDELGDVGYGALTIEAVAARSGVAKTTIYRHWTDKLTSSPTPSKARMWNMCRTSRLGTIRERIERLVGHVAEVLVDFDILALHTGPDRRSSPGPKTARLPLPLFHRAQE